MGSSGGLKGMIMKLTNQKKAADAAAAKGPADPNVPSQARAEAKAGKFAEAHPGRVRKNKPKLRRSGGRAAPAAKTSRGLG